MNLSELLKLGIETRIGKDGLLLLDAPKGALTAELIDQIRQAKQGLIAELARVNELDELDELHPSMFTPAGKGNDSRSEVHRLAKNWRISVPGREPFELTCIQSTNRDDLLARYPRGTSAEPMP